MIRTIASLVLMVAVALPLAGCGRRGNPVPPPGSTYPLKYPYTPFPDDPKPGAGGAAPAEAAPAEAAPGETAPVEAAPKADPRQDRPRFDDLRPPGGAAP